MLTLHLLFFSVCHSFKLSEVSLHFHLGKLLKAAELFFHPFYSTCSPPVKTIPINGIKVQEVSRIVLKIELGHNIAQL